MGQVQKQKDLSVFMNILCYSKKSIENVEAELSDEELKSIQQRRKVF